ncbi:hypothetical protein, partial [Teredinibacter waterburyi]|uniref:hypothetical protein n=1 Tax=Teredinibacter waterburyi TaxID=1500538 RepID=UPI001CAA8846
GGGVIIDRTGSEPRLIFSMMSASVLYEFDMAFESFSVLSSPTVPEVNDLMRWPGGSVILPERNSMLVSLAGSQDVLEVDLATGSQTLFSTITDEELPLQWIGFRTQMVLDQMGGRNRVLIASRDDTLILELDLDTQAMQSFLSADLGFDIAFGGFILPEHGEFVYLTTVSLGAVMVVDFETNERVILSKSEG